MATDKNDKTNGNGTAKLSEKDAVKLKQRIMTEYRAACAAHEEAEKGVQKAADARNAVVKQWFDAFGQSSFRSARDGMLYTPMKRSLTVGKAVSKAGKDAIPGVPEGTPLGSDGKPLPVRDSYYFRTSGEVDVPTIDI